MRLIQIPCALPTWLLYSAPATRKWGTTEKFWPGAPDLAVEVISPSDNYTEGEERVVDWLQAGTRMVVVVNPRQRRVMVHRAHSDVQVLGEGDTLEGGDVVPGWRLTIAELFA